MHLKQILTQLGGHGHELNGHKVFGKTWRGHGHGHEKIRETWRGHGHA